MSRKVCQEEFKEAISGKVDFPILRAALEAKTNLSETDQLRKIIEGFQQLLDCKSSFKDVDGLQF